MVLKKQVKDIRLRKLKELSGDKEFYSLLYYSDMLKYENQEEKCRDLDLLSLKNSLKLRVNFEKLKKAFKLNSSKLGVLERKQVLILNENNKNLKMFFQRVRYKLLFAYWNMKKTRLKSRCTIQGLKSVIYILKKKSKLKKKINMRVMLETYLRREFSRIKRGLELHYGFDYKKYQRVLKLDTLRVRRGLAPYFKKNFGSKSFRVKYLKYYRLSLGKILYSSLYHKAQRAKLGGLFGRSTSSLFSFNLKYPYCNLLNMKRVGKVRLFTLKSQYYERRKQTRKLLSSYLNMMKYKRRWSFYRKVKASRIRARFLSYVRQCYKMLRIKRGSLKRKRVKYLMNKFVKESIIKLKRKIWSKYFYSKVFDLFNFGYRRFKIRKQRKLRNLRYVNKFGERINQKNRKIYVPLILRYLRLKLALSFNNNNKNKKLKRYLRLQKSLKLCVYRKKSNSRRIRKNEILAIRFTTLLRKKMELKLLKRKIERKKRLISFKKRKFKFYSRRK